MILFETCYESALLQGLQWIQLKTSSINQEVVEGICTNTIDYGLFMVPEIYCIEFILSISAFLRKYRKITDLDQVSKLNLSSIEN